jgi:uncharacterized membrane protein
MDKTFKTYKIRFNTQSTSDVDKWRVIDGDEELLVSSVIVGDNVSTTKDYIDGVGDKWHVSCQGVLHISDNIAYIDIRRKDSVLKRHIYKTISYRVLGTLATVTVALCLGIPLELSAVLGIGELVVKPVLYFIHERMWFNFNFFNR